MNGSVMDVLRLTEPDSVVTIPLTSRLALVGSYDRECVLQQGITTIEVNQRTVAQAKRYIFSPTPSS